MDDDDRVPGGAYRIDVVVAVVVEWLKQQQRRLPSAVAAVPLLQLELHWPLRLAQNRQLSIRVPS